MEKYHEQEKVNVVQALAEAKSRLAHLTFFFNEVDSLNEEELEELRGNFEDFGTDTSDLLRTFKKWRLFLDEDY